jgi:hypothetical protein
MPVEQLFVRFPQISFGLFLNYRGSYRGDFVNALHVVVVGFLGQRGQVLSVESGFASMKEILCTTHAVTLASLQDTSHVLVTVPIGCARDGLLELFVLIVMLSQVFYGEMGRDLLVHQFLEHHLVLAVDAFCLRLFAHEFHRLIRLITSA